MLIFGAFVVDVVDVDVVVSCDENDDACLNAIRASDVTDDCFYCCDCWNDEEYSSSSSFLMVYNLNIGH